MVACRDCFRDYLVQCSEEINVFAQLAPLTSYSWIITDKFDRQYSGTFSTDADGFWSIPVEDLPEGLLTVHSGEFYLQVQDSSCKPIKFKIAQEYDAICFDVMGGTREKNTLGCDFTCSDSAPATNAVFNFTDEEDLTIEWTTNLANAYGNTPTVQVFHLVSPNVYQLVNVSVQHVYESGVLTEIIVDNGGVQTGYVLIS